MGQWGIRFSLKFLNISCKLCYIELLDFHFTIFLCFSLKTGPVTFTPGHKLVEVTGPVGQQLFCMSREHCHDINTIQCLK